MPRGGWQRGSAIVSVVCWYCAHAWLTRFQKGMARCPSCRTFNHLPAPPAREEVSA